MTVAVAKYSDAFIPGLEGFGEGLGIVPGYDAKDPRAKERDAEWRHKWFAKRRDIIRLRTQLLIAADGNTKLQAEIKKLCQKDWAFFLTMFGWTYDPRVRADEDPDKPFVLFACQVHKIQEFQRVCADPRKIDIFDTKSRGIGWSDTYCGAALAAWLTTNWSIHFVSYKEDKVYRRNDRSSLFGKIEYKIERLPDWLMPEGFFIEDHQLRLNLYNPQTGASITGESTTSRTARGDRHTAIVYDEAAFIEGFQDVFDVGAGTTNHRFCLSTESYDEGDDWERLWTTEKKEGNPERVWELDWWHNPYQDRQWYEEEKQRWKTNPAGFAREYERNAEEAMGTRIMYPEARTLRYTKEHYDPTRTLIVSIDPGHADDTAIVWGQPITTEGRQGIRWLGSYKRNRVPVDFYAHLLTGIPPMHSDACYPMWKEGQFSDRDRKLMAWFHERLGKMGDFQEFVRFCMDPAGKQEHSGTSFFSLFYAKTLELRLRAWEANGSKGPKPKGIAPNYKFLQEQGNLIVDRVLATRKYLSASEISEADPELWRAYDIQDALRRSLYSENTPRSISQPKPIHGDESHIRSGVEFASEYLLLGMIDPPKRHARKMLDQLRQAA